MKALILEKVIQHHSFFSTVLYYFVEEKFLGNEKSNEKENSFSDFLTSLPEIQSRVQQKQILDACEDLRQGSTLIFALLLEVDKALADYLYKALYESALEEKIKEWEKGKKSSEEITPIKINSPTFLMKAVAVCNDEVIKEFLNGCSQAWCQAVLSLKDGRGNTLLHTAVIFGNLSAYVLLLPYFGKNAGLLKNDVGLTSSDILFEKGILSKEISSSEFSNPLYALYKAHFCFMNQTNQKKFFEEFVSVVRATFIAYFEARQELDLVSFVKSKSNEEIMAMTEIYFNLDSVGTLPQLLAFYEEAKKLKKETDLELLKIIYAVKVKQIAEASINTHTLSYIPNLLLHAMERANHFFKGTLNWDSWYEAQHEKWSQDIEQANQEWTTFANSLKPKTSYTAMQRQLGAATRNFRSLDAQQAIISSVSLPPNEEPQEFEVSLNRLSLH